MSHRFQIGQTVRVTGQHAVAGQTGVVNGHGNFPCRDNGQPMYGVKIGSTQWDFAENDLETVAGK